MHEWRQLCGQFNTFQVSNMAKSVDYKYICIGGPCFNTVWWEKQRGGAAFNTTTMTFCTNKSDKQMNLLLNNDNKDQSVDDKATNNSIKMHSHSYHLPNHKTTYLAVLDHCPQSQRTLTLKWSLNLIQPDIMLLLFRITCIQLHISEQ